MHVTLSLSARNAIGDEGVTALAAGLKDSSLSVLFLGTLSALPLNLVLFTSAPLVLYAVFVADVTLSLSDDNAIGDQGAEALARGLPDSQITKLSLCTLSAAAILGALHERPASALRCFRRLRHPISFSRQQVD